jgi:hypothetical protein
MDIFYYDHDVNQLITEYAREMELLEALLDTINTRFAFLNLDLEDRDQFDEFITFLDLNVNSDHVLLTHACDCEPRHDGLYTWVGDLPMTFKDVLLFTKAKICYHEGVARIELRHNIIVVFCFQL